MEMENNASFGERLRFLMDTTGISVAKVSTATGMSGASINSYVRDWSYPPIEKLIRLADFFAVPLDFLVGRCDEKAANDILKDYASHFMALRREPYEMYLTGRYRPAVMPGDCEAPWPYNLLDDIVGWPPSGRVKLADRWQDVLSPDQNAGLEAALESLTDREHECILAYYRDGLTLAAVAKLYGVTKERLRQVIAKGIRKMRHPSRFNQIRLGLEGARLKSECTQRGLELARKKQIIDSLEAELSTREKALTGRTEVLGAAAMEIEESFPLEEMELSVRSYNVLARAGCRTLGDVEALAQAGKLPYLRNMGRKSLMEVLCRLETLTGRMYGAEDLCE